MNIQITPRPLLGSVAAVTSKSHAHRLLIGAALSQTPTEVLFDNTSVDIETTITCLKALRENPRPILDCWESGSTLRFLLPVAMALHDNAVFTGSGRLPQRPISPLKEEMEAHGCTFSGSGKPGEICTVAGKLKGGVFALPGNVSSQFITGLLFALPLLEEDSEIRVISPLESESYVDLTLDTLAQFNIAAAKTQKGNFLRFSVKGRQAYLGPKSLTAEGDWSNMAFWIMGGLLSGDSAVTCTGLAFHSAQGDQQILRLASLMGGKILQKENRLMAMGSSLRGISIDASPVPDLIPVLAAAASVARGTTRIHHGVRLRLKESDRLSALYHCLSGLGANIREERDGLLITGVKKLRGGKVSGYHDHRIVMAMAIASIVCENPVIIEGAEAVDKSYPTFFKDFKALGGKVNVI